MNGRVYDYNVGRFLIVAPLVHSGSQGINPYSYSIRSEILVNAFASDLFIFENEKMLILKGKEPFPEYAPEMKLPEYHFAIGFKLDLEKVKVANQKIQNYMKNWIARMGKIPTSILC